jgi:lipopolysaccharide transport system permease protein
MVRRASASPETPILTDTPQAPDRDDWTLVIEPHGSLFDLKLKELWQYRDLVWLFVRRDFVTLYKQTILGPAWHLIQPLLTTLMFTLVFGRIAGLPTDGVPPFLFYLGGTILWSYFSGVLTLTSNTFGANAGMFGKVYFPRLAVPVSVLLSRLFSFGVQFALFLAVLVWYRSQGAVISISPWVLATPLLLLQLAALALGLGLIVSALTTRYRDLAVVIGFGVQLLMYASPVIYPMSLLPERLQPVMALNPVAPSLEAFRLVFFGTGTVTADMVMLSVLTTLMTLLLGIVIFNRVERTFMDTV